MKKKRIGVFKFTSCDGCQLALLNMDELLDVVEIFDIAYFKEASSKALKGDFDISIVEGSISTDWQKKEIFKIRERTRFLITIGACATSGGIQSLKNWASLKDYKKEVYPSAELINSLSTSTPISEHVYVDYELWGCPINKDSLSETLVSLMLEKRPGIPIYSLCMDCKSKGIPCIIVTESQPCLGPITKAGCGVLCPSLGRACYGCFGPKDGANIEALFKRFYDVGLTQKECMMLIDKMNTYTYRKAKIEKGL
jgi:coenzyme F420-reducing hydrogenase gamma subunit